MANRKINKLIELTLQSHVEKKKVPLSHVIDKPDINLRNRKHKIIRGLDDRKDFFEADSMYLPYFKKCCALIASSELTELDENHYKINAPYTYSDNYQTSEFKFKHQYITPLVGSAVAIGQNEVLTAYHVVKNAIIDKNRDPLDFSLVFDYQMNSPDQQEYIIEKTAVFQVARIITPTEIQADANMANFGENDFVFLEVTENIPNERIAKIDTASVVQLPTCYAIGYPHKLPAKITETSPTYTVENNHLGKIKLDLFQFNSGSPVFNQDTHSLEGILTNAYKSTFDEEHRLKRTNDEDDNKDTFIKIGYIEPFLKTILNLKKNATMSKNQKLETDFEPIYAQLSVTRFEIIRQLDMAKDDAPTVIIKLYDFYMDNDEFDIKVLLDDKEFLNIERLFLSVKGKYLEIALTDKLLNPLIKNNFKLTIQITRKNNPSIGTFEIYILREIPEQDGSQPIGGTQGDIMVVKKP